MRQPFAALAAALLLGTPALAHQTKVVGPYKVIVGSLNEPAVTMQFNGLDLLIKTGDDKPVPDLEKSLKAEITSPDGQATRPLTLRAQYGKPGAYTDNYMFSVPGVYKVHVTGFIGDQAVDLTFETHEVKALNDYAFPPLK